MRVLGSPRRTTAGVIVNRIGADGQVYGGVVMGIGQALSEGTQLDDDGPAAQPAPARLQARDRLRRARRSTSPGSRSRRRTPGRRARRASASRRACPTAGAVANAIAKVIGAHVRQLPMTPGARLGGRSSERRSCASSTATRVDEALEALAAGARPVAGGTDLVVGARAGQGAAAGQLVAIHGIDELRGISARRRRACARRARDATRRSWRTRSSASASPALADASAIVGSHATRAHGTIGGNVMNASPAMETGAPLICLGATVTLQSGSRGRARSPIDELFTGPGKTIAAPDELLIAVDLPAPGRRARARATSGSSTAARWRSRSSARPPSSRSTGGKVTDARDRDHRARADDPPGAGGRGGARRLRRRRRGRRGGRGAAAAAAAPISDVRGSADYRRAMAAVIARRAIEAPSPGTAASRPRRTAPSRSR